MVARRQATASAPPASSGDRTPDTRQRLIDAAIDLFLNVGYQGVRISDIKAPRDVPSLIGAALMIRTAAARLLGGFDERFFFFLEETDFCVRARGKDYRVVFFPVTRVVHLQGRTVRRTWVRGRIEYAISLHRFIGKYHSHLYERLFAMVRVSKSLLFLVGVSLLPFLLFGASVRRRYAYYARLLHWHAKGRPDDAGLRSSSPG